MGAQRNQSESEISKRCKGWDEGKVDISDEKSDERWLLSVSTAEAAEREAQRDSSPAGFKVIQPSHPARA